ncbi:MAG TPA: cation diffusion facilitator family transporter [Candidatus Binatia bacterium]|nr:cation diffusion facilitator family transporter [Candidatus Binatia bacterium]
MRVSELAYWNRAPGPPQALVADRAVRLRAGTISLVVAALIFAVKFVGYQVTGSTAILSDALESVVNIVAALFTLGSLAIASRPADESHPYGHGKVEFLSSGFEGGLIAFAALVIVYQAGQALLFGGEVKSIEEGLVLVIVAGFANALLGFFLVRAGRRTHSPAIEADGQHVLTDFWTSAGVVVGLVLVRITGVQALDALVAIAIGGNLAIVGVRLLRRAVGGLLDESDRGLLAKLTSVIQAVRHPGVIAVHRLRAIRSGGVAHVDAHVVVPRFWSVSEAHDFSDVFELEIVDGIGQAAECIFHLDPCRSVYCRSCRVEPCPVRARAFVEEQDWSLETLTGEAPEE